MDDAQQWIEVEAGVYRRVEECTADELTRAFELGSR